MSTPSGKIALDAAGLTGQYDGVATGLFAATPTIAGVEAQLTPALDAGGTLKAVRCTRQLARSDIPCDEALELAGMQWAPLASAGAAAAAAPRDELAASQVAAADLRAARATVTELDPDTLQRLLRDAWAQFYLRPGRIWRLARDAKASGSLDEGLRLVRGLGRWMWAV